MIEAVVFDLDGVLVDSEQVWTKVRRRYTVEHGGTWHDGAETDMLGMSSPEWSRYMRDELGVEAEPDQISDDVVTGLVAELERDLPLLPRAVDVVERLAARWPLGLASSANRPIIDLVLARSGLAGAFAVTLSSEEVARGKPAPDVYLGVAERLDVAPEQCAAIEDSSNGIRSAAGSGMRVVAVPNPHYPPAEDALALAAVVVSDIAAITPAVVDPGD